MTNQHNAYAECYSIETAQFRANLLTQETGISHTYEEASNGIFRAVPVAGGAEFLTGEKIPDEVRNKPKTPNLQTVPTISLVDMMARKYVANWLIDGLIEQSDLGLLFGASGDGKSFVVLDMAYCTAAGIPYHGRPTKKTGVLYVCGEGHSGLQKRLKAIHIDKGCSELPNIYITTVPAAFIDENSTIAIQNTINQIGNIGLVFVDTFHRNLGNGDENNARDIARFLQNIDLYLRSSGIAVVVVHHSGNESNGRSRGSSSIRAAMDVEYEVKKMGGGALDGDLDNGGITITVTNTKMKNFEQPKPFSFRFKSVAESVVLEPTDYVKAPAKKSLSNNALIALRCLDKVIGQDGIEPPQIIRDLFPDSPQNTPAKVVTIEQWRVLAYESIPVVSEPEKKQNALRLAFYRVRKDLEATQKIGCFGDYIWRIENKIDFDC
jgi:hypothetical protein